MKEPHPLLEAPEQDMIIGPAGERALDALCDRQVLLLEDLTVYVFEALLESRLGSAS